jgi:phosphopantothenoylcysteine synthetase/decarboxylase
MSLRIVITTGPSFSPIDEVRRLTNFSSGELGTLLAEDFVEAGHRVTCFRGTAATFPPPLWPVEVVPFSTNETLQEALLRIPSRDTVNIVFHIAALTDFRVSEIRGEEREPLPMGKIPSRQGKVHLTLEPVPKLIHSLRKMFPASILLGWKYEQEGTQRDVIKAGHRQMEECLTDACVLNGKAYGSGFGILSRTGELTHLPDKRSLSRFLVEWAERLPMAANTPGQESFHALASFLPLSPFI